MNQETFFYHFYLLRLWRVDNAAQPKWRASLERPRSNGVQQYFFSLDALFAFLKSETDRLEQEYEQQHARHEGGVPPANQD